MTDIDVLVVTPDGHASIQKVDPHYTNLKELIGGGWLEAVGGVMGEWIAYGDEEGNLKRLPLNPMAAGVIQAMGGSPVLPVGTVVFTGQRYRGGEDGYVEADIPDEMRDMVFPLGE
jgi:hypothetical protein